MAPHHHHVRAGLLHRPADHIPRVPFLHPRLHLHLHIRGDEMISQSYHHKCDSCVYVFHVIDFRKKKSSACKARWFKAIEW
ncbi:Os05g0355450 [Oryza sativa Japonica Group]|uniref:Os05g0355450 protein n=2 Tax=Oryza sativa subsp. japonica TaxID=39947 RepID=C7J322_ORYSJ|nr:hypothetical protein EE612_028896 [Oryza sativa]BAH93106.1 Os05g0355450 [Oryza sativa Japonica Group]BAS93565.1 Os05g0355450 [Oryza sativa Japonica Group]|eukprot:NP_001174378.1 Os05g0355450 [Oryza sativa Japonica Group]